MDTYTLTPYLKRRCLVLNRESREELIQALEESLSEAGERFSLETLGEKMSSLIGEEIRERSRKPSLVRARAVFAFTCSRHGHLQTAIGHYLGMDHSSVWFLCNRMREVLDAPDYWADYIEIYEQYKKVIRQ